MVKLMTLIAMWTKAMLITIRIITTRMTEKIAIIIMTLMTVLRFMKHRKVMIWKWSVSVMNIVHVSESALLA